MGFWSRLNHALGFDRASRTKRELDLEDSSRFRRVLYFIRPALALFVILYTVSAVVRLSVMSGDDLDYPRAVLVAPAPAGEPGSEAGDEPPAAAAPQAMGIAGVCRQSRVVDMTIRILDVLVNENSWIPSDPQYKVGWFGLVGFQPGPFLDNKASFQIGALRVTRRISMELADILGRVRGTSAPDVDLEDARALLQWSERAWLFNPFDDRLPLFATSATSSYRNAIRRLERYNERLASCDAMFDARADNLFQLLDRFANDIGGMVDQLNARSANRSWDLRSKTMVETGWNWGYFDWRADNLFHEGRGMTWALHGLMQAAREDFANVVAQRNLESIWDRMEAHIAGAASLNPLVVSNGAEDGFVAPAHLASLGVNMLSARSNMTEAREILNR